MPSEVEKSLPVSYWNQSFDSVLSAVSILDLLINSRIPSESQPNPLLLSVAQNDVSAKSRLFLAALLVPYLNMTYQDHKQKEQAVVTSAIRDSLKLGTQNHYLDGIPALFSCLSIIKKRIYDHQEGPLSRVQIGLLLRDKSVHNNNTGSHWTTSFFFSLVTELLPCYDIQTNSLNGVFVYHSDLGS